MSSATPFVVMSRGEKPRVLFEGQSLPVAAAFVAGCPKPSEILVRAQQSGENVEDFYAVCLLDSSTGQILAEGPTLHLLELGDLLENIRVAVLPLCVVGKGSVRR